MILVPLIVGAGAIAYFARQRTIIDEEKTSEPAVQPAFAVAPPPDAGELGLDEFSRRPATGDELETTPFRMFVARLSEAFEFAGPRPVQSNLVTGEPVLPSEAIR